MVLQLKLGENISTIPTIGFNVEEIVFENLTMTVWDVGGQEKIRALWRHYYGKEQKSLNPYTAQKQVPVGCSVGH